MISGNQYSLLIVLTKSVYNVNMAEELSDKTVNQNGPPSLTKTSGLSPSTSGHMTYVVATCDWFNVLLHDRLILNLVWIITTNYTLRNL